MQIDATRRIHESHPKTGVLVITMFDDDDSVFAAMRAGARGYLLKDSSPDELVRAIRQVHRGEPSLHPVIARKLLQELRGGANKIIDTSRLAPKHLKEEIATIFADQAGHTGMHITIVSFGYKYGIPLDSDLVIDVRFLPNPHYQPELSSFTGNDPEVRDFVFKSPVTEQFMKKFTEFVEFLIPEYISEGKTTLMIAIGCTGGMHRSVALANRLVEDLGGKKYRITVRHRDVNRK